MYRFSLAVQGRPNRINDSRTPMWVLIMQIAEIAVLGTWGGLGGGLAIALHCLFLFVPLIPEGERIFP